VKREYEAAAERAERAYQAAGYKASEPRTPASSVAEPDEFAGFLPAIA
jgi:hypothetical protein